jgi:hypothetical protein
VILFGTPKFNSCVDWIADESKPEGTILKAKELYSISEDVEKAIVKMLMAKKELG